MAKTKKWVVTTAGPQALGDVQRQLTESGFSVEQVLTEIGCLTGAATEEVAARARAIPGVVDVSPDLPIDIGPPDAPVTW